MFIFGFTVNLHSCNQEQGGWGSEGPHTNISALDSSCLKICSRVPISWDNQGEFVCTAHVGRSTCSDLSLPQGLSLGSQEQGLAQELIQFPSFVAHVYLFFYIFSHVSNLLVILRHPTRGTVRFFSRNIHSDFLSDRFTNEFSTNLPGKWSGTSTINQPLTQTIKIGEFL